MILEKINSICKEKNITLADIVRDTDVGRGLYTWNTTKPTAEKVLLVAKYLNVSVSYLLGETDLLTNNIDISKDENFISIQRAYNKMGVSERNRMIKVLELTFEDAFSKEDSDDTI